MADEKNVDPAVRESEEDSAAYTKERLEAAQKHLEEARERDAQQFVFLGVPEPEVEIPSPEDRPIDWDSLSDDEKAALERQNEVASDSYSPKTFEAFTSETFESEGVNPDAKEFQLREPDEYTGPEAAEKAYQTGFNPRTVATSTNPDDLVGSEEAVEEITGKDADSIREEQGGVADGEEVKEEDGSGVVEDAPQRRTSARKASKSSTDEEPNKVEK